MVHDSNPGTRPVVGRYRCVPGTTLSNEEAAASGGQGAGGREVVREGRAAEAIWLKNSRGVPCARRLSFAASKISEHTSDREQTHLPPARPGALARAGTGNAHVGHISRRPVPRSSRRSACRAISWTVGGTVEQFIGGRPHRAAVLRERSGCLVAFEAHPDELLDTERLGLFE